MLGVPIFHSAAATLDGIEVAQMIRKGQLGSTESGFINLPSSLVLTVNPSSSKDNGE